MKEEKQLRGVGAFAEFALIRHWRATFPLEGEGFFGGTWLCVIPLSNGDPACWRPPGGAPAGGISVVPEYHGNAHHPPGTRTKGWYAAFDCTLACFALIRHWRATFPTRGKATAVIP